MLDLDDEEEEKEDDIRTNDSFANRTFPTAGLFCAGSLLLISITSLLLPYPSVEWISQ